MLGEGVGVIVLKRLADALRDGDRVWAVLRGIGMNNDGRGEGPMTPRQEGQRAVLERAYRDAGISPDTVGFLEAHGTATSAGDQAEFGALKEFFAARKESEVHCALSSVKANIGHSLAAAGIAGLIKSVLVLNEGIIPPQASFTKARPSLEMEGSGFWVPTEERAWCADRIRRAAVSAFGFGGTNVHVILDAPPPVTHPRRCSEAPQPFLISAPNTELLAGYLDQLEKVVAADGDRTPLIDFSRTLTTRRLDSVRVGFAARTHSELHTRLAAAIAAVRGATGNADIHFHAGPAEKDAARNGEINDRRVLSPEWVCEKAVTGEVVDWEAVFAGQESRLAWLPPSPLAVRPIWAVKPDRRPTPPAPPASSPAVKPVPAKDDRIEKKVLAAVAKVGAYPVERLRVTQHLMGELGFDSLMALDLAGHLDTAFPGLGLRLLSLVSADTTIGDLIHFITAKQPALPTTGVATPTAKRAASHVDRGSGDGPLAAPNRNLTAEPKDVAVLTAPRKAVPHLRISPEAYRIEDFPEVQALRQRLDGLRDAGTIVPYFGVHQGVAGHTSRIAGHDCLNFSSYNYLGLSGDPVVTAAAQAAIAQYGTSVSASRVAAGEKPLHRELETALARFLGCEEAVVMVGGHATNVTVIGHLLGPEDLVLHDSLAHDSIVGGARLSGARRRPFPHNDLPALDCILSELRPRVRRVLIAVEGAYSMDGDLAPLDRLIEIKKKYQALLFVDEAHSLGVLGRTGRGAGEHFGIARTDVDLWMGTLSKSLASCGGYIAGSRALVEYLKYTTPGFVYSVGISPANAAAALAALGRLDANPELIARLQQRSRLFLRLCQERGIDTGFSCGSAVVPCIVGNSQDCLGLSEALAQRGINVQPILAPAVPEGQARLRFFLSASHTEERLRFTADALAEERRRIRGDGLATELNEIGWADAEESCAVGA